jgi:hypothetical protein
MQQLPQDGLPQTVQDAISVAKAIPVDYLWIDAMCILQDSAEDKAREIERMAQIYSQSTVTIVAASSEDMNDGFLQTRPDTFPYDQLNTWCAVPRRASYALPFRLAPGCFGTVHLRCSQCSTHHNDGHEPVNKRAWTLQEQILAQRLLVYSSQTLRWRCRTLSCNLDNALHHYPLESPLTALATVPQDKERALKNWNNIVNLYTRRSLSISGDKLPALAAVAQQYAQVLGPGYFAGLWEYDLGVQLCWGQMRLMTSLYQPASAIGPYDQYHAPSWSWVSSQDVITEYSQAYPQPLCEVVSIETTPKYFNNPYGEVVDGHIILRGKLRDALIGNLVEELVLIDETIKSAEEAKVYYERYKEPATHFVRCILDSSDAPWCAVPDGKETNSESVRHVKCFLLQRNLGMLLEHVSGSRYKRIGLCRMSPVSGADIKWRLRTISKVMVDAPVVEVIIV